MKAEDFKTPETGELVAITGLRGAEWAFVPAPLPPKWSWPVELWPLLRDARVALASLSGIGKHLPDPTLLLRPLQYREAVRSNSLEGTFTQPVQQALFELAPADFPERTSDAYREVSNYARALQLYLQEDRELPLSLRLIRELHAVLMDDVRGADKEPGRFRRLQVHVGLPPRYVPPPPDRLDQCLDAFEKYLHCENAAFDPLVDAFIVHYQFEAIHPFRDGNGRVGRLLLSAMIAERCHLSAAWLHMSAYFDNHKDEYIDRLFRCSTRADWEGWIQFCLTGVIEQAVDTEERCDRLLGLRQNYVQRIAQDGGSARLLNILDRLFHTPVLQIPPIARYFDVTYATARADIDRLARLDIVVPLENIRQKTFFCPAIFDIIYQD